MKPINMKEMATKTTVPFLFNEWLECECSRSIINEKEMKKEMDIIKRKAVFQNQ